MSKTPGARALCDRIMRLIEQLEADRDRLNIQIAGLSRMPNTTTRKQMGVEQEPPCQEDR